jgi:hypothetical protein
MLSSLIPWITLIKAFFELHFMIDVTLEGIPKLSRPKCPESVYW